MCTSSESRWSDYYTATKSRPLNPHYEKLEPHLPDGGTALELGCGVGRGVLHLLEKGFEVTAVDAEAEAIEILRAALPEDARATLIQSRFQDLELRQYDLVVAHFSLFFLKPDEFVEFWPRLAESINPGGILSCQLLGVGDDWNDGSHAVHTRQTAEEDLRPFEVLFLDEVERDGETAVGIPKHWHVFHIVARKRTT